MNLTTEQMINIARAAVVGLITIGVGLAGYTYGYIKGINNSSNNEFDCDKNN